MALILHSSDASHAYAAQQYLTVQPPAFRRTFIPVFSPLYEPGYQYSLTLWCQLCAGRDKDYAHCLWSVSTEYWASLMHSPTLHLFINSMLTEYVWCARQCLWSWEKPAGRRYNSLFKHGLHLACLTKCHDGLCPFSRVLDFQVRRTRLMWLKAFSAQAVMIMWLHGWG